ncbi:MAG: hypothetical protein GXP25_06370 [Planctomycetes bacterium]|nr:hypothetical protein [Planctomycetota bacterium]
MSAQNIGDKVPKYGPAVPPVGVLWSALRVGGEGIELDFLTGITGAAFRTCVDKEVSDEVLWAEGNRFAENALPILGYELHFIARGFGRGPMKTADREKIFTTLQVAIDGGTPVFLTGSFGWALVLGYDKGKKQYWVRQAAPWNTAQDMSQCPPWHTGAEQEERWEDEAKLAEMESGIDLAFLQKRGRALPNRGLAINALRHAVTHMSRKSRETAHFGLGAIRFLREQILSQAEGQTWGAHIFGAALPVQVIFTTLNRTKAAVFLRAVAEDFGGEKGSLLGQCASAYDDSAQTWLTLQCSLPNPKAYYESKESVNPSPDILHSMAELLKQIAEIEERALHLLEGVV